MLCGLIMAAGCSDKYDDSALSGRVEQLEERVERLEELCRQMNTNIASLQGLVAALEKDDRIVAVTPIVKEGATVGYTITFKFGDPITIYHGKDGQDGRDGHTPVIGVALFEGAYYWTVDGEWLTDAAGAKIRAEGRDGEDGQPGADGKTPRLKIEGGYWYVSTDDGATWTQLGQATGDRGEPGKDAPNPVFSDVADSETEVVFTLTDGTTITIPKAVVRPPLDIAFSGTDFEMLPGKTYVIDYTLSGADERTTIDAIAQNGYRAEVDRTDYRSGRIVITAPDPGCDGQIMILISDGDQRTVLRFISIAESVIILTTDAFTIEQEGGTQTVEVETNIEYTVEISELDRGWVSLIETRAPHRKDYLTFSFTPNPGTAFRYATVELRDKQGKVGQSILFTQRPWGNKTLTVETAGTLESLIPADEKDRLWGLELSGTLDEADYAFMRSMPKLIQVDLSGIEDTTMPDGCFKSKAIEKIVLPQKLEAIPAEAFYGSKITSIAIPASVLSIGYNAFYECRSLAGELVLPERLQTIGGGAFEYCEKLTGNLTIPGSVTEIGSFAFWKCKGFDGTLTLGDQLTRIGDHCFRDCTGFKGDLIIPEQVAEIGDYAFYDCTGFRGILVLGSKIERLGSSAFARAYEATQKPLYFGKVFCKAVEAPSAYLTWPEFDKYPYLGIPKGSRSSYYSWLSYFSTIEEISDFEQAINEAR